MPTRQPIVCVLGHVDTGKTSLLDKIRKSSVQAREVGGMTQHIGASFFPIETLMNICGPLLGKSKERIKIPGLLVIDTPGHEAFANLRKRGGGVADIAILVIDVLKRFEKQTYECIDILKARKTPFLVAANKIDRIPGWVSKPNMLLAASYESQDAYVKEDLDNRLYEIMGEFSRLGFRTDRYNKITDFTRTIAIVPVSAKTGEGIPELLAVLVGLTQQYLTDQLQVTEGPAKGTVLEVKEEPGLGITINAIIYDGVLHKGDTIVIGGKEKPIITKTRAVLLSKPLDEIRDPRDKFSSVDAVPAAAGVKIAAPELENALAGAPLYSVPSEAQIDDYVRIVSEEVQRVKIATGVDGVVLKTDALGSLEALAESLKHENIPIRLADVGDISKRDVTEAAVVKEHEPFYGVILAFNVKVLPDAEAEAADRKIPIFNRNIIYHIIEDYTNWMHSEQEARLQREYDQLIKPGKVQIMQGFIFRRAKPAIVGVEVLAGRIRAKYPLIKADGTDLGEVSQIQDKGENIPEAKSGMQVAISLEKPIVGRHIDEKDVLYVKVPESHVKLIKAKFQERLSVDEQEVLDEYIKLMQKKMPFWGV
ncbi:MAG TPA: translation initiation factor IF-2 [Candidatus Krumholzibacteriaceae bacterium]|nr:translation initiation factor IF-2 [Candidatus Krumholzibacteriaceae bacterium]